MVVTTMLSILQCQSDKDQAFQTYQRWLLKIFPLLIFGNKTIWTEYRECRDYLLNRFPELCSHMAPEISNFMAFTKEHGQRDTICSKLGTDHSFLYQLEQNGLLNPPKGVPPVYSSEDQKKIYWAFFFQREMGINLEGLEALLSLLDFIGEKVDSPGMVTTSPIHKLHKNAKRDSKVSSELENTINRDMLHDIGTPLHVIGGRASLLKRKLAGSEIAEKNLSIIQSQVEKINNLLQKYSGKAEECYSEANSRSDPME